MVARSLRTALALGLVLLFSSCISFQGRLSNRPLVYNVRNVTVMADARIPLGLISEIDRRVSAAIAVTRPPQAAERVVLLVKIDRLGKGEGARRRLDRAYVTVTATSVETGDPVAQGSFTANSSTDDPRIAQATLAEEIAARLRFEFSLAAPARRILPPPRTISTRLSTDPAATTVAAPTPPPTVKQAAAPRPVTAAPPVEQPKPVVPAEMAAPPVVPPAAASTPAIPVQPTKPAAEVKPGASVEDGARGTVRLNSDCDPTLSANCLTPKP